MEFAVDEVSSAAVLELRVDLLHPARAKTRAAVSKIEVFIGLMRVTGRLTAEAVFGSSGQRPIPHPCCAVRAVPVGIVPLSPPGVTRRGATARRRPSGPP